MRIFGLMMRITLFAVVIITLAGCVSIARYDGPYEGRIIDAETRQPLEGVVVFGEWKVFHPNLAGGNYTYYDAAETLTDKNGEFRISGKGVRVLSNLTEMYFLIFKTGYDAIHPVPWSALKGSMVTTRNVRFEGSKAIIPLRKLTLEERKKRPIPGRSSHAPLEKQKKLTDELNKECSDLGYDLYK